MRSSATACDVFSETVRRAAYARARECDGVRPRIGGNTGNQNTRTGGLARNKAHHQLPSHHLVLHVDKNLRSLYGQGAAGKVTLTFPHALERRDTSSRAAEPFRHRSDS